MRYLIVWKSADPRPNMGHVVCGQLFQGTMIRLESIITPLLEMPSENFTNAVKDA